MTKASLLAALGADILPFVGILTALAGAYLHAALPPSSASVEAAVLAAAAAA